jgi:hypothetical protein
MYDLVPRVLMTYILLLSLQLFLSLALEVVVVHSCKEIFKCILSDNVLQI